MCKQQHATPNVVCATKIQMSIYVCYVWIVMYTYEIIRIIIIILVSWQVGIWNSVALLVHDVLLLRISAVNKEWRTHTNTQLQTHNDDKDIYYLWDCFWGTLNCFTKRLMGKNFQTENKQLSCSWDSWLFKKVLSLVSFFHASLIRFGIIVKWFHTNNVCV